MFDVIESEKIFSRGIAPYSLIEGEFDVCQPYFRAKEEKQQEQDGHVPKKRKRNTNAPSNADVDTQKRHQELRPLLELCIKELPDHWPQSWKNTVLPDPNRAAIVESDMVDFPSIQQMVEMAQGRFSDNSNHEEEHLEAPQFEFVLPITTELDIFSIFNLVCINTSIEETKLLQFTPTTTYLIPPRSSFLMGSMQNSLSQLGTYVSKMGGADLVVMDPPWPNKSVKRSSHYATQDIYDLYAIPMKEIIGTKDSIVAIWVTNKPKFRKFIIQKLFPAWHLECVSEWVWLKMTTQAECIFPIDSEHKKPYEQLIIGRPIQYAEDSARIPMPKTHIIASVPSVRHSRKPPLEDVLNCYLTNKETPVYAELFARCLLPGWISWGNECLKFQHLNYFSRKDE